MRWVGLDGRTLHKHLYIWTVHTWPDTQTVPSSSPALAQHPKNAPFHPKGPSQKAAGSDPFPALVIHVSICPSPIRVRGLSISPASLPPPWGKGGSPRPHPDPPPHGTWGSLWGVPGQAPSTHLHPGAPAAPFCPDFTPKQVLFCPSPSAQRCMVRVSPLVLEATPQILP